MWTGSAFKKCNNIVLVHSQGTQYGTCNSGAALIGYSLRVQVENDNYNSQLAYSQLNITVSHELDETSIECVHDNGSHSLTIGQSIVELKGNLSVESQIKEKKLLKLPIISKRLYNQSITPSQQLRI